MDKNLPAPKFTENPLPKELLGNIVKILPVKDKNELQLFWPIELLLPFRDSKPEVYIEELIGHEGENSLLSMLLAEGLANELSASITDEMNLFSLLTIDIHLSEKGKNTFFPVFQKENKFFPKEI